jgi:hypothetical protein
MPSFRFLYEWKDEEDVPANDPLQKELEKVLEKQWEWPTKLGKKLVPSDDAKALVAYLLSLKRDGDLPKPQKQP